MKSTSLFLVSKIRGESLLSFSVALSLRKANFVTESFLPQIIQPFAALPALHSVLFEFLLQVTSGISTSTLDIHQERTSQFYLLVEWTSAIKGFCSRDGFTTAFPAKPSSSFAFPLGNWSLCNRKHERHQNPEPQPKAISPTGDLEKRYSVWTAANFWRGPNAL